MASDVAKLIVALQLKDALSGPLGGVARSLNQFDSGAGRVAKGVGQVGVGIARIGVLAGVAAAGGLAGAIKTAVDFETAFAGVKKTVDETTKTTYPVLLDQLRELAKTKPQSFEELAQIGEFGGQLGVSADNLRTFVDTVSDFLVAVPGMSLEEAAFGLQRLTVLTQVGQDGLDNLASTIVGLGNNFATTESDILSTAERFASVGTAAGFSAPGILAMATAMTALGGQPQEAGTSAQRLFQNIQLAIADGGDQMELFADVAGIAAGDFRKAWERDAEGTLLSFLKGLGEIDDAIEQTRILDELGLSDARLGKNVINLANNFDTTRAAFAFANKEYVENNDLTEEAAKRYETAAAKFGIFRNILRDVGATIGNAVLPSLVEMAQILGKVVTENQDEIKAFAESLGKAFAGFVESVKAGEFDNIISGLKTVLDVGSKIAGLFLSLPKDVIAALAGFALANKASGGLIGTGLGNIGKGALELVFRRGATPANPLFVADVTGGLGRGGGGALGRGAAAAGAGAALAGPLALGAGIFLPFAMFNLIPSLVNAPAARRGSFESGTNTGFTDASGTRHVLPQQTTAMFEGLMPGFGERARAAGSSDQVNVMDKSLISAFHASEARQQAQRAEARSFDTALLSNARIASARMERIRAEARMSDVAMLANARLQTSLIGQQRLAAQITNQRLTEHKLTLQEQKLALNRIAAKPVNPVNVNVTTNVTAQLSVQNSIRTQTIVQSIRNNGQNSSGGFI